MGLTILRLKVIGGHRNTFNVCRLCGPGKERIGIVFLEKGAVKIHQRPFFLLPGEIQCGGQGSGAGHAGQPGPRHCVDAGGVVDPPAGIVVCQKVIRQGMKTRGQSLPPGLGKPGQILVAIIVLMNAGQFGHAASLLLE